MTIIAIDGPSGSGKSTIARLIAEKLELPYLDTGAMYRAVGMVALERGIAFEDGPELTKLAAEIKLDMLDERPDGQLTPRVVVSGADVTKEIRTPVVSQAASAVAVHPGVRERLVRRQRNWVENRGGAVVEGRDIGSVVFPNADLKVFLTADDEARVQRRLTDPHAHGFDELSEAEAHSELTRRDHRDSTREASPLRMVDDAVVVDTSDMDIDEVAVAIFAELRRRHGGQLPVGVKRR